MFHHQPPPKKTQVRAGGKSKNLEQHDIRNIHISHKPHAHTDTGKTLRDLAADSRHGTDRDEDSRHTRTHTHTQEHTRHKHIW